MKLVYKISLTLFLLSLFLLISGSPLLLLPVLENPEVPLGNLSTALGMIALPTMLFAKLRLSPSIPQKQKKPLLIATIFALVFALFWWPLGRYLSGNWRNSFKNLEAGWTNYWTLTYILIGFFIILWLVFTFYYFLNRNRTN